MSDQFQTAIRSRREELGLSKRKAAEMAHLSEGLWRQYEMGYRQVTKDVRVDVRPTAGRVRNIARALSLPVADLLLLAGFTPTDADIAADATPDGPDPVVEAILADASLLPEAKAHFLNQLGLLRRLGTPARSEAEVREAAAEAAEVERHAAGYRGEVMDPSADAEAARLRNDGTNGRT